jgi:hypothetical protein
MLSVKPSVGLRAGFVDLSAFVPELLICRPSCWKCGCRPSCRPSSCRFLKPPHVEEVLPKFSTFLYNLDFYLVTRVQFLFIQRLSGASSNHVGGSPGSHVGASLAGASPGSHVGASPAGASPRSQLPWATRGLVFMFCTCELGIMCTFGYVVCMCTFGYVVCMCTFQYVVCTFVHSFLCIPVIFCHTFGCAVFHL